MGRLKIDGETLRAASGGGAFMEALLLSAADEPKDRPQFSKAYLAKLDAADRRSDLWERLGALDETEAG